MVGHEPVNRRSNPGAPGTREWWHALFEADNHTPSAMSSVASRTFQFYVFCLTDGSVRFALYSTVFKTNSQLGFVEIADMLQLTAEDVVSPQEN